MKIKTCCIQMSAGDKLIYIVFRSFFRLLSILPWRIIDFLSFIIGRILYVFSPRNKVVKDNLKVLKSFDNHINTNDCAKEFYYNISYQFLSVPKLMSLDDRSLRENHFRVHNMDVLKHLVDSGHKVIFLLMGHYGNWELFSSGQIYMREVGLKQYQLYRPQKGKLFDRILKEFRESKGSESLPKDESARKIINTLSDENASPSVFAFIADQSPSSANVHYFTRFLGRETAFLTGFERLARKFDIPVVYMDVVYERKGCYNCHIDLLSDKPKDLKPMALTEMYAKRMEKTILRSPLHWLWSHRRWKIDPQKFPDIKRSETLAKEE